MSAEAGQPSDSGYDPWSLENREDTLHKLAVQWILSIMRSASTDKIDPKKWWVRAQSAMEAAVKMSTSYPMMCSIAAKKLQIAVFTEITASSLSSIEHTLTRERFGAFKRQAKRDSIYIVAEAQIQRQREREVIG